MKSFNRFIGDAKSFFGIKGSAPQPPTRPSPSGSSSVSNKEQQDLVKCFCGVCESFFKRSVIKYALQSNGDEILRNPEAKEVLKKFLIFKKGESKNKLQAEDLVELYALSYDIINGIKDLGEERAVLDELLFNEFWEEKLIDAIKDGSTKNYFEDIMLECAKKLENTPEYLQFKEELKKKLK